MELILNLLMSASILLGSTQQIDDKYADTVNLETQSKPLIVPYRDTELNCLAKNIYYEAGSESDKGQLAVGFTTINRTKHPKYPDTICRVVKQRIKVDNGSMSCQFSWYCMGGERLLNAKLTNENYHRALKAAKMILTKQVDNWMPHVVSFNMASVGLHDRHLVPYATYGNQTFYRESYHE